jgi:hypothetical protein
MPVILATQEAEIRKIEIQSQPDKIVQVALFRKNPSQRSAGGMVRAVGSDFKSQYHKKLIN